RELDPQFDEREIERAAAELERGKTMEAPSALAGRSSGAPGASAGAAGFISSMPRTGAPARRLASLPDTVREFQSPGRAQAFVLALLLSKEPDIRARQLDLLASALSVTNLGVVQQVVPTVDAIDPMLRLPALLQVFPSLR